MQHTNSLPNHPYIPALDRHPDTVRFRHLHPTLPDLLRIHIQDQPRGTIHLLLLNTINNMHNRLQMRTMDPSRMDMVSMRGAISHHHRPRLGNEDCCQGIHTRAGMELL